MTDGSSTVDAHFLAEVDYKSLFKLAISSSSRPISMEAVELSHITSSLVSVVVVYGQNWTVSYSLHTKDQHLVVLTAGDKE